MNETMNRIEPSIPNLFFFLQDFEEAVPLNWTSGILRWRHRPANLVSIT